MKRTLALTLMCLLFTGCLHNVGTAFYGKVFNIGYDPELNKFGIQYYNGLLVTGLQKELSETNFTYSDVLDKTNNVNTASLVYKSKNGLQVTGYQVDLEKLKSK